MGAFKNEKNGTWYVQFRYTDWQGLRQQKLKRGFATKREAQEWERAFLTEKKADVTMPFKTFTELYEKDVRPKLKENTWLTKEHIIKTKILPYTFSASALPNQPQCFPVAHRKADGVYKDFFCPLCANGKITNREHHDPSFGAQRSRRASPNKLNPAAANKMHRPG